MVDVIKNGGRHSSGPALALNAALDANLADTATVLDVRQLGLWNVRSYSRCHSTFLGKLACLCLLPIYCVLWVFGSLFNLLRSLWHSLALLIRPRTWVLLLFIVGVTLIIALMSPIASCFLVLIWIALVCAFGPRDWVILTTNDLAFFSGLGKKGIRAIPRDSPIFEKPVRRFRLGLRKRYICVTDRKKHWYGTDIAFCEFTLPLNWMQAHEISSTVLPLEIDKFLRSGRGWSATLETFRFLEAVKNFLMRRKLSV